MINENRLAKPLHMRDIVGLISKQLNTFEKTSSKGDAMAPVDLLRHLKLGELTVEEKAKLKKTLKTRIRVLQNATKKLDQSLKALERKRKRKTAKRKSAKRKR